jgi:hypothetical protein
MIVIISDVRGAGQTINEHGSAKPARPGANGIVKLMLPDLAQRLGLSQDITVIAQHCT